MKYRASQAFRRIPRRQWLAILLASTVLAANARAAISEWSQVQWLTWTPAGSLAAVGSDGGNQVSVNVAGANGIVNGTGTSFFDAAGNSSFSMATPTLGLGAPRNNGTTFYTFDFSSVNAPISTLVFGLSNLDAINGRGSILLSALDTLDDPININLWTVEAQFKEQAGSPAAQALVTLNSVNTFNVRLGSVQAGDNTAWGDSRGIFFTGLPDSLETLTLAHSYNHSNAAVSDSISFYIGVIPEPFAAFPVGAAALSFVCLRRRQRLVQS